MWGGNNFIYKDVFNEEKNEYCLNYLKLSFQHCDTVTRYQKKSRDMLYRKQEEVFQKEKDGDLDSLELEKVRCVLEKWQYFEKYVSRESSCRNPV